MISVCGLQGNTSPMCTEERQPDLAALFLSKFQGLSVSGKALGSSFAPLLSSNEVTHHWLPWASVSWGKWFSSLLYWLEVEQPSVLCCVLGGAEPLTAQSFYPWIPACNPAVASKPYLLVRQNLIISGHSKAFRNILNCVLWAGLQCQVFCISDSPVWLLEQGDGVSTWAIKDFPSPFSPPLWHLDEPQGTF